MSRIFLASTFATLLCASLAAQATQQPPSPSPSTPRVAAPAPAGGADPAQDPQSSQRPAATAQADSITIEGCIQRGASSGATAATAGTTAPAPAAFMLTSAMKPAGSSSPTTVASSYRRDADASKLTPHVGHKVEISGTVQPASGSASAAAAAPTLKVDNVKMLAATCTP